MVFSCKLTHYEPCSCKTNEYSGRDVLLQLIIFGVWVTCILYNSPKFYLGKAITVPRKNSTETICAFDRRKYNSELFDITHFVLFYNIPLIIMSVSTAVSFCYCKKSNEIYYLSFKLQCGNLCVLGQD
jgi:hypothetical protein